ncbi:MAG: relaxase/mobilization nuclease domain-containing protein [Roseburia sp.]
MSVTSIHQCKNLKALIEYCITPKAEQEKERVAKLYCDLGDSDQYLTYALNTVKAYKRKVQGYTILQSFPRHELEVSNEEHIAYANKLGRKLVHELYPNSPCMVVTHADSAGECVHNHIVVLNHDLTTNGCIRTNRHYRYVKQVNDRLMERYGFEVCQPSAQKQTQGEYWSNKRNGWYENLKKSVDKALSHSTTIQEFHDCLLAEGVTPTLYKANGALKERFAYKVTDSDGKEHKKRSDKLGERYTRQAIEETLLANRKKRQNNQQPPILSMSEWIELQQAQKTEEKPIQSASIEPIELPVVSVAPQSIITTAKESKGEDEKMQKEIIEQEKVSRQLQKQREMEYQELLKERQVIQQQLRELKRITENADDICTDEDYAKRDSLDQKLGIVNFKIKRLKTTLTTDIPEVKINNALLPNVPTVSKDVGLSL